ncbi:cytochrome c oxidase assembly protein [Streptomyces sp. TRM66268-LWL]|uniref:Cytochrome c oxidase assembly protein n=1 Tax=Streptomyces polyasparticus TaxID=2767826 RepID=A0ABR7SD49_9ACTN|nr:cytochrome c oxidase assembly protein [Streptomyces polyasparticus]MBC9712794.1 cytochrome c oxidase assembly protein [Streptomyces polyasparticus]
MTAVLGWAVAVCCLGYVGAAARLRTRGDAWSLARTASFCAGGAVVVAALSAPWDAWPPFTGHMAAHLALGMVAPLLLAVGRPVTLALRALPVAPRRALLGCVRSRAAAQLMWPPFAALVHTASLWALYRTPVLAAVHHRPWAHLLVSVHLLLSGLLFTFAVLAAEPVRHRTGTALRAGALLAASAAHGVLAKSLYATAPPGTAYRPDDLHAGSQLMYYGGDITGIALAVLLAHQWYAAGGRALHRERRHALGGARPGAAALRD